MVHNIFSERFSEIKKSKGITRQAIADYLDVTEPTIVCYVKSRNFPTVQNLIKLADLFDVSLDYLVGRSNNPAINAPITKDTESKK
jgi:transcriptional regulator with XRE-family HTH domain